MQIERGREGGRDLVACAEDGLVLQQLQEGQLSLKLVGHGDSIVWRAEHHARRDFVLLDA
eukprot:scaffold549251_cov28-Prasinocladus_malaysianus.AAC.1